MKPSRREFVQISAAASAGLLLWREKAYAAFAQTPPLQKFIQKIRLFGPDIPLASARSADVYGADYYEIAMTQFTDQLHPALSPTTLRGYTNAVNVVNASYKQRHLEGAILAKVGTPVRVKWFNELPTNMPLPVDRSLITPYASGTGVGDDRAAPHLHGGLVPWPSDGGPFHWFNNPANNGGLAVKGASVLNWLDGTDDYWYPNIQTPRFMWYHDHAVGITRLNAYAGLASGYILTGPDEGLLPRSLFGDTGAARTLMNMLGIPEGDLTRQVHLVVQDKIFFPSGYGTNGSGDLWYPDAYDTQFFALAKNAPNQLPFPSTGAEFWGDTMLMNGTVYPYMDVEPRRYRFRILNACNTRFLSLRLVGALGRGPLKPTDPVPVLSTEPDVANPGPPMTLIGTEGGFLDGNVAPKGVVYNNTAVMPLVLGPAERADIIVDFSKVKTVAGKGPLCFILYNDAPVPFPGGTPLADFFPQNNKLATPPAPGFGPNTRTLLQFRVVPLGTLSNSVDPTPDPAWSLPPSPVPTQTVPGTRDLALYETVDAYGRLAQNLGTLAGPLEQLAPPTEVVQAGTVEVWRIFNVTADTHPMHFHFFNVRVLSRQPFSWRGGMPNISGQALPPDPAEQGWKETVKFNPGECTTLLVELPPTNDPLAPLAPVPIPPSPRLLALKDPLGAPVGIEGAEYVWHCHILEHEEHDMMRPLVVQG